MIILFCGPPASGKSTIARMLASKTGFLLLSTEKFKRKVYRRLMAELKENLHRDLILDGTFYRERWRREILEIARQQGIEVLVVLIKSSLETSLARDSKRESRIGEKAVKIIHTEFEYPEADVVIDSDVTEPEEAVEKILRACRSRSS